MMETRVPDWLLERLAQGELPDAEAARVRGRLDTEADGPARLDALIRANEAILADHPAALMGASIRARLRLRDGREARRRPLVWAVAAASPIAAAVALLLLIPADPPATGEAPLDEIRLKGMEPGLQIHRSRSGEAEVLPPGAEVRAHDLIQLSYTAAGRPYGAIVSIDGGGAVTLHHPAAGGSAATLSAGGAVPLPRAYELDDAPRFERFILITSSAPFAVETALAAARSLAADPAADREPLQLPEELEQTSILVRKTP